ncbi:MAG: O-antigen ligase family protein [Christensenellales bacterium]
MLSDAADIRTKNMSLADFTVFLMILAMVSFADQTQAAVFMQAACIAVIFIQKMKEKFALTSYFFWLLLFLIYAVSSYFWADNLETVLSCALSIAQIALVGFFLVFYMNDQNKIDFVIRAFIISALILCVRVLVSAPVSAWGNERIGLYIGYNSNKVGYSAGFAALWCIYQWKTKKKKPYLASCIPLVALSFLTGSRKAFFILFIGIALLSALSYEKRRKMFKTLLVSSALLLILYIMVMNIDLFYNILGVRLESMMNSLLGPGGDRSSMDRLLLVQLGVKLFASSPVIGYGLDNFRYMNSTGLYAHNNFVELGCDLGLIGLVIYYSLLAAVFIKTTRHMMRGDARYHIIFVMLLCLFIMDFGVVSYSSEIIHLNIAVVFSLYQLHRNHTETGKEKEQGYEALVLS